MYVKWQINYISKVMLELKYTNRGYFLVFQSNHLNGVIIGVCYVKNATVWANSKTAWFIKLKNIYTFTMCTYGMSHRRHLRKTEKLAENAGSGFPPPNSVLQRPVA